MPDPLHVMTDELKKYLLEQCTDWMLPEETRALGEIGLNDRNALVEWKMEKVYGPFDNKVVDLLALGRTEMETEIARLLARSGDILVNNCPNCGRLARSPKAEQCRHCGHDWHYR